MASVTEGPAPLMTLGPARGDQAAAAVDRLDGMVVAWDSLTDGLLVPADHAGPHVAASDDLGGGPNRRYRRPSVSDDHDGDAVICFRAEHGPLAGRGPLRPMTA